LLRGEMQRDARRVAEACLTFEEWAGRASLPLEPETMRLLLHTHCHQKALVGTKPGVNVLSQIPGCEVTDVDAGCCGMAGSFGYEKEHFELSMQIGELVLFPTIRKQPENVIIAAAGTSCRHQIKDGTGRKSLHPVEILWNTLV
jgi:Fe-S oxidoreductase